MARPRTGSENGFTLVEVMVAISVLLIGVLGTVTMIDTGNATTTRTKAREGGTALARSVLEISRGVPYRELTSTRILDELGARAGMADALPGVAGHQIESAGFTYTVLPEVCLTDDPIDGLGDHDDGAFCADSDSLGAGQSATDRNADDYRRVAVRLQWAVGASPVEQVRQTAVVTNPVGGLGPSVTSLTPDTPSVTEIFSSVEVASYDVTTSAVPASVSWSIDGARLGTATGTGTSWGFDWDLGPVDTPDFVDCVYVVQAEAFDDKGRAGAAKALTVTLNRRRPFAPPHFAGGRNLNGGRVDLQWEANRECDVTEYRVYRGTDPGSIATAVCTVDESQPTGCVDETAPSGVALYYQVLAVDTPAGGGSREGDRSAVVTVAPETANGGPPDAPAALTVCTGGTPGCNDIDGEPAPTGLPVLSWPESSDPDGVAFYRVYRDGATYADRLDVLFKVPDKPLVFIDAAAQGSHAYRVSAVDELFGESALTGPVTWP